MTGLYLSELRRLTARRLLRVTGLVVLGITVLALLRMFTWSQPAPEPTTAQRAQARAQAELSERNCEDGKDQGFLPPEQSCDRNEADYLPTSDNEVRAVDTLEAMTKFGVGATALLAFVFGATYVGADWSAGTMQSLLYWEPRRHRVLLGKAAALVTVSVAWLVAFTALLYVGTWLVAATRGSTVGVTTGLHLSNLLSLARGVGLVSMTSLFGYGITGLARATGAALGAGLGYFVFDIVIRGVRPTWEPYLPTSNIAAVVNDGVTVLARFDPEGGLFGQHLSAARGFLTLGVYLAIVLAGFWYTFTRRDVT